MGFFNDKQVDALLNGKYICSECGANMKFEDEWESILVCLKCGHSVDSEHYGFEKDEDYDALYPTKEEVVGYEERESDEDDTDETYTEVCDELD